MQLHIFTGSAGGSFFTSWKGGIPEKNPYSCCKRRPCVKGLNNVVYCSLKH